MRLKLGNSGKKIIKKKLEKKKDIQKNVNFYKKVVLDKNEI